MDCTDIIYVIVLKIFRQNIQKQIQLILNSIVMLIWYITFFAINSIFVSLFLFNKIPIK